MLTPMAIFQYNITKHLYLMELSIRSRELLGHDLDGANLESKGGMSEEVRKKFNRLVLLVVAWSCSHTNTSATPSVIFFVPK
jgi:hypothetical protein